MSFLWHCDLYGLQRNHSKSKVGKPEASSPVDDFSLKCTDGTIIGDTHCCLMATILDYF